MLGVARFSTYDFKGLEGPRQGIWCWDELGRYPWPVTTSGEGPDAQLWIPLGHSHAMAGEVAETALRRYAEATGTQLTVGLVQADR